MTGSLNLIFSDQILFSYSFKKISFFKRSVNKSNSKQTNSDQNIAWDQNINDDFIIVVKDVTALSSWLGFF